MLIHLRKARDHIDRHFTEPIELDDVAAVAGLSKFHFHRLFKAVYGVTPARYLTQRRVERAQDLLRSDEPHRDGDLLRRRILEPRIVQYPLLGARGRNAERIPTALCGIRCAANSQLFPVHVGTRRTSFVLERFRKTGEDGRVERSRNVDVMISNVSLVSVWVKDIEESKAFYIDVLGFEERDDVVLGDDFRWCTVGHPSQPELHVHLTTPGPPLSPDFAEAITRAQTEGGTFALGISVDDCVATVVDLESKGVEVINHRRSDRTASKR